MRLSLCFLAGGAYTLQAQWSATVDLTLEGYNIFNNPGRATGTGGTYNLGAPNPPLPSLTSNLELGDRFRMTFQINELSVGSIDNTGRLVFVDAITASSIVRLSGTGSWLPVGQAFAFNHDPSLAAPGGMSSNSSIKLSSNANELSYFQSSGLGFNSSFPEISADFGQGQENRTFLDGGFLGEGFEEQPSYDHPSNEIGSEYDSVESAANLTFGNAPIFADGLTLQDAISSLELQVLIAGQAQSSRYEAARTAFNVRPLGQLNWIEQAIQSGAMGFGFTTDNVTVVPEPSAMLSVLFGTILGVNRRVR